MDKGVGGWRRHRWRWWWVAASWLLPAMLFQTTSAEQRFANQPSPQTAVIGTTVVLPCRVINKVGELQWTRDDFGLGNERELYAFKRYHMIGSDEEGDFSLRISPVTLDDEGYFQCQVTGWRDVPGVRSQTAKLTVYVPPEPPSINQGNLVISTAGAGVLLECISKGGKPAAEIQWLDGSGRVITEGVKYSSELMPDGHRSNAKSTLSFEAKREHHNTVFTCSASNPALHHALSMQVRVEVRYAPEVTITHDHDGYREGETATLTCSANANPNTLTFRWYRDGDLQKGNNSTHLVIPDVSRDSNLEDITCEVSNEVGTSKKITRLAIHYGPSFTKTPADHYADLDENITLLCQVDSSPEPTIVWINQRSQTVIGKGREISVIADKDSVGTYLCIAKVHGFPEISAIVGLFLKNPPRLNCENQQWGKQGENVMVECLIRDAPVTSLTITWVHQGHQLDLDNVRYEVFNEVTTIGIRHTLIIRNAKSRDFGKYNCSVLNEYGRDSFEVVLNMKQTVPLLGLIVGFTGGVALVLLIVMIVFLCAKKSTTSPNDSKPSEMQEKPVIHQVNDHNSTANDSDLKVEFDQRTGSSLSNKDAENDERWGEKDVGDHSSTPTYRSSANSSYYTETFTAVPTKMNGHLNSNGSGHMFANYADPHSDRQQQLAFQSQHSSPVIGFIKASNGVSNNINGGGGIGGAIGGVGMGGGVPVGGGPTLGSSPQTPQNLINASQHAIYPGYSDHSNIQEQAADGRSTFSPTFNSSLTNQSYKSFSGSVPLALHVNSRSNGTPPGSTIATSTIPRLGIPVDPSQYIVPPRSQALQGALATHV